MRQSETKSLLDVQGASCASNSFYILEAFNNYLDK
jgi:hypothetical protein